jgi:hypothetical protein
MSALQINICKTIWENIVLPLPLLLLLLTFLLLSSHISISLSDLFVHMLSTDLYWVCCHLLISKCSF